MILIAAASAVKDAPADTSWVAIAVSVIALVGSIAGTVLAPWLREREERKTRAAELRRSEIRRLIVEIEASLGAYLTEKAIDKAASTRRLVDFSRHIGELEMWVVGDEMAIPRVFRVSLPSTGMGVGPATQQLVAAGMAASAWYRGEISPLAVESTYATALAAMKAQEAEDEAE